MLRKVYDALPESPARVERNDTRLSVSPIIQEHSALFGAVLLSALFSAIIMLHGIPALRQDWNWPTEHVSVQRFLLDSWSGWSVDGIGMPAPYPSNYLIAIPMWGALEALGPWGGLIAFVFGAGLIVSAGAYQLARRAGSDTLVGIAVMAFALFNPWVYAKVVAGHMIMVIAYGGTMLLVSELFTGKPRWPHLAISLMLICGQIQFFLIALTLCLLRNALPAARKSVIFGTIIFLPSVIGIALNWGDLENTPYILAWQREQSVAPLDGVMLMGYFAGYQEPIRLVASLAVSAFAATAVIGLLQSVMAPRRASGRFVAVLCVIAAASWIVSTGTKGLIAPFYENAVRYLPISGVYRELFDCLAYLAIFYCGLTAFARGNAVKIVVFLGAAAAVTSWLVFPPSNYFVSKEVLPEANFKVEKNTRYALLPAFQPMAFHDQGSGIDPDSFTRAGNATPLNSYLVSAPQSAAIALYNTSANSSILRALSVSMVVTRPWLRSDDHSLKSQLGSGYRANRAVSQIKLLTLPHIPELTINEKPLIGTVADRIGDGNVFWGDGLGSDSKADTFHSISVPNVNADADHDWVAAALTFVAHPEALQGLGGVATDSQRAVFLINYAPMLLVYVHGTLRNNGQIISHTTDGYEWIRGASSKIYLTCDGYCAVSGYAARIPKLQANPPPRRYRGIAFRSYTPWLLTATLPPMKSSAIRYNVRYNKWWLAFADLRLQRHMRLDQTMNGWIISGSRGPRSLLIVNGAAAIQTILEICGVLTAALVLATYARRLRRLQFLQAIMKYAAFRKRSWLR